MRGPALPDGWEVEQPAPSRSGPALVPTAPKGGKLKLDPYNPGDDVQDVGTTYTTTGKVVDGDTIQLNPTLTGRLFGLDAFERGQMGYRQGQPPINLGKMATDQLMSYVRPSQPAFGTGRFSYGRPVVTLGQGLTDPARASLLSGTALAAPSFMDKDPARRGIYMEDERLARINRQGAHATEYMSPDIYRSAKRWGNRLRPDEEAVWTSDVPEFKPDLKRLTDEQEQDYYRFLASNVGRPDFGQADLDSYWTGKGYPGSAPADEKFLESVRKGNQYGTIDYSAWDQQALRDFNLANGFAGLRPEVQQAYNAILSDPGSTPDSVRQFADVNGLSFDPRDIDAFYAARARGENPNVPIPIINPGDGAKGAGGRGFADTLGFLDELGGVVDATAPVWMQDQAQRLTGGPESFKHRETIWNSDRSFGDIYRNNLRQNRAIIDYDETRHPYARAGGQVVGGIFLPFANGVRGVGNLAKAGAVEGGLYGYASGDGTPMQRLANVPLNATVGGVLGLGFGKGEELLRPLIKQGVSKVGGRLSPKAAPAAPDAPPVGPWGSPTAPISPLSPRQIDRINIPPSQTATPRLPALGDRVPSAAPEAGERSRGWIDIAEQPTPRADGPVLPDGWEIETPRMNMDAEDALPSLSSPPLGPQAARPRPLLDPATDAMLRANAERVQPSDVLPRPSNEVQSLDESMRISEGLYPNLRAPNERDALSSRAFPSRVNPENSFNVRGPLDLVSFARSQGGMIDEAGELTASGLSNAARKGDDFAGNDPRLGRLIDNEAGVSIEQMAQRATDAGYFDRLPTNDEFVQALGSTYRGNSRVFRPDDFNEIEAFNAARDQRFAVERSRQEGAPLADDIGQPATYDDMLANSPPASAYEDWHNAVQKRVGNINIERLNSPTEISQAMKVANDIGGGFDAARRGKMSFEETARLAEELGMTADDLLARRKGQAFNAEEAAAARALNRKASIELVNMAQRFRRNGGEVGAEDMAKFRAALLRKAAIQEQVSGMTAEAGRLLSQFRMAADSVDVPGHVLRELASGPGGAKRLNDIADGILEFEKDPRKLNQFVQRAIKPKFSDMLVELMYNFRLSGLQTHGVNILSNSLTALGQLPEHMGGVAVGAIRRGVFRNKAERALMSDVGQRAIGMMEGTWEGLLAARQGWKTGEAADFVGKVESNIQKAIPNWAGGEFIRMPTRALTAEDEFFKAIARRGQLRMMAASQARKEGLKGQEFIDRKNELVDNPPDEMLAKALDFARYVTFQKELGPIASRVSAITNDYPALKIIVPFVRTPSNLIKFAFERSPAAPLMKEWRDQVRRGGTEADLAIARMLMGTGVGAIVAQLAQEGKITGSLPKDETKANVLLAQGWKPYSIRIGDQWVSYQRLDPFATTIGSAADMATLGDGLSDKQLDDQAMIISAAIINNLASKTWLSGVSDMLQAARDPERYGAQFIRNQVAGLVVPAAVSQTARTIDPVRRETPSIGATIQSRIPGLSDDLLPKRDLWGKEIANEDAPGPDIISPLWTSTQRPDPIGDEILRVGANASKPSRTVGKSELTDKQYDDLQRLAGPTRRRYLDVLLNSDTYRNADVETQRELIRKAMSAGRSAAKDNVLSGVPIPETQGGVKRQSSRKKEEALTLPDGWVVER